MTGLPTLKFEVEFTAGSWTDVSSRVNMTRGEVTWQNGRSGKSDDGQPGTCSATLENYDGAFTPDNPSSAYFPNVVPGKRVRLTVGGVVKFVGPVISWDPSYASGVSPGDAVVAVSAKDNLGVLQDVQLPPLRTLILPGLGTNLAAYWPLSDPAGTSLDSLDAYTTAGGAAIATAAKPGFTKTQGAGSLIPGLTSGVPFPDGDPWAVFTGNTGDYLVHTSGSPINTGGASGATIAGWFLFSKDGGANDVYCYIDSSLTGMALQLGTIGLDLYTNQTSMLPAPWGMAALTAGTATHVALVATSTTVTLYLNGAQAATSSGAVTLPTGTNTFGVSLSIGTGPLSLGVSSLGYWQRALSGAEVAQLCAVSTLAGYQQQTFERVQTLCSGAGLSAAMADGAATHGKVQGQQATSGKTALAAVQLAMRGDTRLVYDNSGTITVRTADKPRTVSLTLDAEADLDGAPVWQRSLQTRYSTVTASSTTAGEVDVTDATAMANTATVETALASRVDLLAAGSRLVSEGRDAKLRLAQCTVDLMTAQNAISAATLGLTLGDRVRVSNLPTAILGWSYQDGFVLGVKGTIGVDHCRITLDMEPADAPAFAVAGGLDQECRAMAGPGVLSNANEVTSSETLLRIASSTGPFLTPDVGEYPLDLDLNGERITVSAAPSSTTRTNLCPNPSIESAITGWAMVGGGSCAQSATRAYVGTKSMLITWPTVGASGCNDLITVATTIGHTYTASAWVWVPTGNPRVDITAWFVANGTTSSVNDAWQRLSVTFTATGATTQIGIANIDAATAGQTCYVDAVLVEEWATGVGSYFDGATAGCSWTGTADLSTSTQPVQSMTISRGVAPTLARSHIGGEPVDIFSGAHAAY